MLGSDPQHVGRWEVECGADPGIFEGSEEHRFRGKRRAEPDANDTADSAVPGTRRSEGVHLPPPPVCEPVHAGRRGLLTQVDEAPETLSGPATKRILEREFSSTNRPSTSGWRGFRWRIFKTCASFRAIAIAA